ncbi:MAG: aspartyl-trna synthetase [Rhodobacteraceae bacterium]|nr:MAG: aspartyl-trna synthetase [Paracoccaceae bacterium]
MLTPRLRLALGFALALNLCLAPISAPATQPAETRPGPVTNLPLPRFVSLNVDRANVRRGPGLTHRIDWVFLRRDAPLEVVAEHGHWRKVRDQDNADGWVHHSLLRGRRTAVITSAPDVELRAEPAVSARVVARAEAGVIARVLSCAPLWCRVEAGGVRGWAPKTDLWGVRADETF